MKINCIIGIDPGSNGGIVCYRPGQSITAIKMPKNLIEISQYLDYMKSITSPLVFVEKLTIRPDDITINDDAANLGKLYRIQKMMQNFEQLKTILTLSKIPYVLVNPMKWQSTLKLRKKGIKEEKSDRKRRYRDVASHLYHELKPTLWNSDATLIMHFGRYVLQNDQNWLLENLPEKMHNCLFE